MIYTRGKKIAEHGGFGEDDTHVALLVSEPHLIERPPDLTKYAASGEARRDTRITGLAVRLCYGNA